MKLNNVIILNRRHLKEFFSFTEFWKKKKEFLDMANSEWFFKEKDVNTPKRQLKAQVAAWINGYSLTSSTKLEPNSIILPSFKVPRIYTKNCPEEILQMTQEEAMGVVCLYELMERNLKNDIYEVLACLGHEVFNPNSGIVIVQNKTEIELSMYENGNYADVSGPNPQLRNVLIANLSSSLSSYALVKCGYNEMQLKSGECLRTIFYGTKCVKILPVKQGNMKFVLNQEKQTTELFQDGTIIDTDGNVLAFTKGNKGYLYAVDSKEKKFKSCHCNFTSEDFNLISQIGKEETIIDIVMNSSENKCLFLTDYKKLYLYDCNEGDEIKWIEDDVLKASFINDEIITIKK